MDVIPELDSTGNIQIGNSSIIRRTKNLAMKLKKPILSWRNVV